MSGYEPLGDDGDGRPRASLPTRQPIEMVACCTCGYEWPRGKNGSHICSTYMQQTIDRLMAELAETKRGLAKEIASRDAAIADMPREMREAKRDAERYRWLQRFDHFAKVDAMLDTVEYNSLDAAIDAAMQSTQEGKG